MTGEETYEVSGIEIKRSIRNIASGGGVYPTEIFIVNQRIHGLPKGVYHYEVIQEKIALVHPMENTDFNQLQYLFMASQHSKSNIDYQGASFFILFTSVLNKHSFKYQDFGILLSLLEVGEFIHSAYLSCSTLDLGGCVFGGILNDEINKFLDLRNPLHYPVVAMAVGNKA
ncbi:SagB family peptide dehydrogenase [Elizabethkingia argenteiflava]|uniref:SagB family peptide dehydrogenase n=1 Tax=Elizabethkingia argenteiflava TaxID=2681556 RepID=UPI00293BD19B|nr:SagB family peptide dehydrogenase [Elizabethkingia argenteiflava]